MRDEGKERILQIFKRLLMYVYICIMGAVPLTVEHVIEEVWAGEESVRKDDTLKPLVEQTTRYFKPLSQRIIDAKGGEITIESGGRDNLIKGMRVEIFREGEMFYHPVTNEPVGRFEKKVGMAEVIDVKTNAVRAAVLVGDPKKSDIARISSSKKKLLFYQCKTIDWYVGDAYYRQLKEDGCFEMLETKIISDDVKALLVEAKKVDAELLTLVDGLNEGKDKYLRQRLYWVSDGKEIFNNKMKITEDYIKSVKTGSEAFVSSDDTPLLTYQLSTSYDLIAVGDLYGDKEKQILLSAGSTIRVFTPTVDLHQLWAFDTNKFHDNIYLDVIDIDKNGKDEVIVTSFGSDGAYSYIYEIKDSGPSLLWKTKGFLRVINDRLLFQGFSVINGFSGSVTNVVYDGSYRLDSTLQLPKGVNIYDFAILTDKSQKQIIMYYDKDNHVVIADEKGIAMWRSKDDFGGFIKEYTESSIKDGRVADTMDYGNWHISDRVYTTKQQALVIRRNPLTATALSLGYTKSSILSLWWNGSNVDENVLIANIGGNILDYAINKDRIYVLNKPMFGMVGKNILKGENPFVTILSVFPFIY
ncbi:MAG: hypothetical protein HQL06_01520 [Nitrospirae bacterium]|nr:hypothetical protein [Nitrospirota bacterium]